MLLNPPDETNELVLMGKKVAELERLLAAETSRVERLQSELRGASDEISHQSERAERAEQRLAELEADAFRIESLECSIEQARHSLAEILAVILRDGGHRQSEVGDEMATSEAVREWYRLVERVELAEQRAQRLEKAAHDLCDAIDARDKMLADKLLGATIEVVDEEFVVYTMLVNMRTVLENK